MCRLGFAFLLAVVVALAATSTEAVSCSGKTHDALFGRRRSGDELLFMDHPKLSSKLLQVVTYDVNYPPRGEQYPAEITSIEVYDQKHNGNGGCAYIQDGGVGQNHVKIHLKSQRNHGLDFTVKIYGMKRRW